MAAISAARKAAFPILLAVERGRGHSDDLLRGKAVSALSTSDRHLATALVLGVLRWQIQLDSRLQVFLKRPQAKLDAEVLIALRLGAFQLLHLDRIPARAAIDESVELTKKAGHRFASGMVNAVLRKLAGQDRRVEISTSEIDACPAWMVERWIEAFCAVTACTFCRHGQAQPALALSMVDAAVESELTHAGILLKPGELLTAARILVSGVIVSTSAFREGRVRIQDEG